MNGIHDLGGMHDLGPVPYESAEPIFHEPWEGRVFALHRAMGAWRRWNIDASRFERELIPPAEYLRMSYYERWLEALVQLLSKTGLVSGEELESGRPGQDSLQQSPALSAERVASYLARGSPANRDGAAGARFLLGEPVRARNMHPEGHTRLPRYARGKSGTIVRHHGTFVFPDTNAHFRGEDPQHLYSVTFSARELWGPQANAVDSVRLDLWESYLEPG